MHQHLDGTISLSHGPHRRGRYTSQSVAIESRQTAPGLRAVEKTPQAARRIIPKHCEVVELRHLADANGIPCSRTASHQCSDCGIHLCDSHIENRAMCLVFCPSCMH